MPTDSLPRRGWCVYLVKCSDDTLYTGITNDLRRRVDQHNRGAASRYTRSRLPVQLTYREGCRDKSSALKKERRIKSLSRRAKEALIAGAGKKPGSRLDGAPKPGVDSCGEERKNHGEIRSKASRGTV